MPRPRTPTSTLENRGAFLHNPQRREDRAGEPVPTKELGPAPATLTPFQAKIWDELATIIPAGVAFDCDRWVIERAVRLMSKVRRGVAKCSEVSQLITCLSRMGMTPADRSRVRSMVTADAEKSTWDEIDEEAPVQ
jgi:hypothetical protein